MLLSDMHISKCTSKGRKSKKKLRLSKRACKSGMQARVNRGHQFAKRFSEHCFRLEDALTENHFDLVQTNCRILYQMFGIPKNEDILHQIDHENTINLKMIKKTHRTHFRLYNCDLLQAENLKMGYRILKNCHELKKVQLEYCRLDDRTMAILMKVLAIHPQLLYLGECKLQKAPKCHYICV